MEKPKTTPKDFFLWAGAIISFYWSVIATIYLIFNYINYTFPNALSSMPVIAYDSGISGEMASIIVLLPAYMFLMWFIHKDAEKDPSRNEIWVRRWAIILTLFLAGLAIVDDLITLLTTFLNGEELTTAFLLKVLVILLVAAGVFMHFIADLKGYWTMFPQRLHAVRIAVAVLALVIIGSGFFIVGTPAQARLMRFDVAKVQDLQNIQYQITDYWQRKQKLPASLTDLNDPLLNRVVPVDKQTGKSYEYQTTGIFSFKLCAGFNGEGSINQYTNQGSYIDGRTMPVPVGVKGDMQDNWQHGSGTVCFDRTIDPSLFPPIK